ncbi:hypothetical protein PIB30_086819 [Stylosanthes scabra]|uniref:NB-ARC domain-containing protein n=1 Tax=Stylosanthes scabra TaxID=79078 RepID=A0ABU6TW62_9FABA|nr:hypothetical protein [Stylosanthes scabra]
MDEVECEDSLQIKELKDKLDKDAADRNKFGLENNNEVGGKSVSVVSIVGMGGLGKTTLAKYVFNDKTIDGVSPLKIWVCVSDEFDLKQIMIKILKFAPTSTYLGKLEDLDVEQLQKHLRHVLADKKFLLVMDDVWNRDRVKWEELRNLLKLVRKEVKF